MSPMQLLKIMAFLALATTLPAVPPDQAAKPRCSSEIVGKFRSDETNRDPEARRKFAQSGEIEICVRLFLRHKWQRITVSVAQLQSSAAAAKQQAPRDRDR